MSISHFPTNVFKERYPNMMHNVGDSVAAKDLFWSLMDKVTSTASHIPNTNVRLNVYFENRPFRTLRQRFMDLHDNFQPLPGENVNATFAASYVAIQINIVELEDRYRSCQVLWEDVPLSALLSMVSLQSFFCLQTFGKWDHSKEETTTTTGNDSGDAKQHYCHPLALSDNRLGIAPVKRNADWYDIKLDSLGNREDGDGNMIPYTIEFHTQPTTLSSLGNAVLSTHTFPFVYSKSEGAFVLDVEAYRETRSVYIDMSKTNGITENVMYALVLELDLRLGRGDNKHRNVLTSSELTQLLCLIDYLGLNNTERLTECGIIKF